MMRYPLAEHPGLQKLSEMLPENSRLARAVRVMGKALLSGKSIIREKRVLFEGIEDAILENRCFVGPGPDEILVKTLFSGVSPGTEKGYYLNLPEFYQARPYVPGYSGCGVVKKGHSLWKKGTLVAGLMKHSSSNILLADQVVAVPQGVDPLPAAFVSLGVIASVGVRAARVENNARVAVMGQGILGQIVNQLVRIAGCGKVTAIALSSAKKALAEKSGVDEFIALESADQTAALGEFDVVIDSSGTLEGFESALDLVKPGGRVVMLGSIADYAEESTWANLVVRKGIEVRGAHVRNLKAEGLTYRDEAGRFLLMLAEQKLRLDHLINDLYEPEFASEIYRRLTDGDRNIVGAAIDWRNS